MRRRLAGASALVLLAICPACVFMTPKVERTNGIPYGTRGERSLTLDVIQPRKTNGIGILMLVSGGWKSRPPGGFPKWPFRPLLKRGYTVFAIGHVSQPRATVSEIAQDMHRAVRFVRHHAADYGIDPQRIGITGGSAGGHLGLLLATRGQSGPNDAPDPVDRESSVVQAVSIFYPVTDLLNLGSSTENPGNGGPPKSFVRAFGPQSTNLAVWKVIGRELSPIYYVGTNLPPILICHGDADTLVPIEQSLRFQAAARAVGGTVEVRAHRGGRHGWLTMPLDIKQFADWFDRYLRHIPDAKIHPMRPPELAH
jgi:acetyl esterase/lipase